MNEYGGRNWFALIMCVIAAIVIAAIAIGGGAIILEILSRYPGAW